MCHAQIVIFYPAMSGILRTAATKKEFLLKFSKTENLGATDCLKQKAIDTKALLELFGINHLEQYQRIHKGWIEDALKAEDNQRM